MGLKVTDIQDKNGQSREIQDKDLAGQTSASVINSTDYVMLQDTSGGYHKISRTSFADAVRDVLGSSINSAAKGTDIAKLPVLDSSNNLGMGTLANVASVLGGLSMIGVIEPGSDLNSYTTPGVYYTGAIGTNTQHLPDGLATNFACTLYVSRYYNMAGQILFSMEGGDAWVRHSNTESWKRLSSPSFYKNYSDLSSLANALGVWQKNNAAVTDYNDCIGCGYWVLAGEAQNQPTQLYGLLFGFGISDNFVQVALDCRLSATIKVYMRTKWLDNWSDWYSVTLS